MADQNRNPRNADSTLFKKLTRLFSGPIVTRRKQTYRRLRRSHLDVYGNRFKSISGQHFKKSSYNPFENLQTRKIQNQNRAERYREFDQMEYNPYIASALDMYADEMTTSTTLSPIIDIKCPNEEIKMILESLYYDILSVEHNMFGWCRTMCKYGDFFAYADIDEEDGVRAVYGLPSEEIERLEGEDKTNPNYLQYQWNSAGMTFENWQVLHFRINGNDKYAPYGSSVLEPARRAWRQVHLLEDSMMAYRIVRSPERRAFYIDVGNIAPQDVEQYMERIITNMKRHQIIDEDSGRVDLRYNPLSVDEDYYIPIRGNTNTRIETLPGGTYAGDIEDVKYLRDKLFAALKVPQSYLSKGDEGTEADTTLAQKDIHFARTIQRLQRSVVSELEKIGIIHLLILGYPEEDTLSFGLSLNNPSKIAELQELETWRTKMDVANQAAETHFSFRWVAENVYGLSEQEIMRIKRELYHDAKFDAAIEQILTGEEMMGGGEGMPDDMGGLDDETASAVDLESEPEMDMEMPPEESDDDESDLIAAPGKRDSYTTPGAKGKMYKKVATDKRSMGARKRNMKSGYKSQQSSTSRRNVVPGLSNMISKGRGVMTEDELMGEFKELLNEGKKKDSNYYDKLEERMKRNKEVNIEVQGLVKEVKQYLENTGEEDNGEA